MTIEQHLNELGVIERPATPSPQPQPDRQDAPRPKRLGTYYPDGKIPF